MLVLIIKCTFFIYVTKESVFSVILSAETHFIDKKNDRCLCGLVMYEVCILNYRLLSSVLKDNKVHGSFFMCISNLVDQDMWTYLIYCLAIKMNKAFIYLFSLDHG